MLPLDGDAVADGMRRPHRARALADRLNHLGRAHHRHVLNATHATIARTGTGQASEQRSQEKQQVQIGSLGAEGCDIVCRVPFV